MELKRGDVNMDTYRIPLVWQMYGHCDVDANSLEDAIKIALRPDTPLPDGSYVDDSVAVDHEAMKAYLYMVDVAELSTTEAEHFGLDMEQYKEAIEEDADDHAAPSSAGGDYSPANPWDAPGMSPSDFI